jgi:hypothetical protein
MNFKGISTFQKLDQPDEQKSLTIAHYEEQIQDTQTSQDQGSDDYSDSSSEQSSQTDQEE